MENLELVDNVLYTKYDELYFDSDCLDIVRIPITMSNIQCDTGLTKSVITQSLIDKFNAKFCSKCNTIMDVKNFSYNKKVKCGLNSQCVECRRETTRVFNKNRSERKYTVKETVNTILIKAETYKTEEVEGGLLITIL